MASTLYRTDGRVSEIHPHGERWTMEELQSLVGGNFQVVRTVDARFMVINEEGKRRGLELNIPATRLYQHGRRDVIVGPALIVDRREDLE